MVKMRPIMFKPRCKDNRPKPMRLLNPLDEHVETTLCLGLSCMPLFFRICRPTSVGTENPEIKVDLSPRR